MRSESTSSLKKNEWRGHACLCLAFAVLLSAGVLAQEIYVDDDAGAPGFTQTIAWSITSNVGAGWNGGKYHYRSNSSALSTVTWTPTIPSEGIYEVTALFRRGGDRTASAPFTVNHADGSSLAMVDQTGDFGGDLGEAILGSYRFVAGSSGTVTLSNTGGSGAHIADTIRFRPDPAPVITNMRWSPLYPQAGEEITITGRVVDNTALQSVNMRWRIGDTGPFSTAPVFDDGTNGGDQSAGDAIHTATLASFENGDTVTVFFEASDEFDLSSTGPSVEFTVGEVGEWALVINEVLSSNGATIFDPDFGDTGDWIEIHNLGPDTADLSSTALSDDPSEPDKWNFPLGTTLGVGEYMVVWCDGMDFAGAAYHTSFKIDADGESAVLYDLDATTYIDQVAVPALGSDVAYARLPNLGEAWATTINPTPGESNLTGIRGDAPAFSQPSGLYAGSVSVEITAPGATAIRYTTNGSEPTAASTLYTGPLTFTSNTGLRARAFYTDIEPSLITTASYFFDDVADRNLPIVDMIVDPADLDDLHTNYEERGFLWERPVHVVIMDPDGSNVHEAEAGFRVHGGTTRDEDKKSYRIYLRNLYGQSEWTLPWLVRSEAPAFSQMVFRAGGNDVFYRTDPEATYLRDQLMRDFLASEGEFAADGFFAALYINGEYWGLYNMTERISDDLMEHVFGGEDWDVVKGAWESTIKYFTAATDGTDEGWFEFLDWVESVDLSTPEDFATLKTKIDYDNFITWMALNIACQNHDWPQNNWIATQRHGDPDSLWTFHEWDSEWPLAYRPTGWQSDSLLWAQGDNYHLSPGHNGTIAPLSQLFNGNDLGDGRTVDINGILDNPQGRLDFIQAMEDVLNFTLAPQNTLTALNAMADAIETEIPREAQLWSDTSTTPAMEISQWYNAVDEMRDFMTNRPDFVRGLMMAEFGIAGTKTITFQAAGTGQGRLFVNGRGVDLPWTGTFFDGSDVTLEATPNGGSFFVEWNGEFSDTAISTVHHVSLGPDGTVNVVFGGERPSGWMVR